MSDQDTQHSEETDQFEEQMEIEQDGDEAGHADDAGKSGTAKSRPIYLPEPVDPDEEFVGLYDPSAYVMHQRAHTGAPCLSFDVLQDDMGDKRETFPLTCYIVAGTQAADAAATPNEVIVLKLSNMQREKTTVNKKENLDDDDIDSSSGEDQENKLPTYQSLRFFHQGCVNRIRSTVINARHMAATWSENKKVYIWDLTESLCAVESATTITRLKQQNPIFTFSSHRDEGFAIDWSKIEPGTLATGDCSKDIHIWRLGSRSSFSVSSSPLIGHSRSVEDLQWSPTDTNYLASCSIDKSIRIWDVRSAPRKACKITIPSAHDSDINAISWNKMDGFYLASGGEDGVIKVWDMRQCKPGQAVTSLRTVVRFKYHTEPITSIEWCPHDRSVLAASSEDNELTLWDVDATKADRREDIPGVPAQLFFIHQGQDEIKELHWHPQLPGVIISTANSDFNIFRTHGV